MHAIKQRAVGFYKWLREPQHVEKASRRERIKRDIWMMLSFIITFATAGLAIGLITFTAQYYAFGDAMTQWQSLIRFGLSFAFSVYIDAKYVFPWGVRRFDITIPWQFREAQMDD